MRRYYLPLLLCLLPSLVLAAPPRRADLPAHTSSMVHIDVEAIQKRRIGRELIEQVLALPSVDKQLKALPESLGFLKQIELRDLTVLSFPSEEGESSIVVVTRLSYDQSRTQQLLTSARDYAQVTYHGVPIHQWRANMNALGDMLLDRERTDEEKEEDKFEPIFAAAPDATTLIVSRSLKHLNSVLDRRQDRTEMIDADRFAKWTKLDNCLVHAAFDQEEDLPSNMIAQLCVRADERVTIVAESICKTAEEKHFGGLIANVINNVEQYRSVIENLLPKSNAEGEDEPAAEEVAEQVADEPANGKRTGSLSFGVSVDDKSPEGEKSSEDWIHEIGKLISRTASASFKDGVLKVRAEAYPDEWTIDLKSEGKVDKLDIKLKLFSSKEKYLASEKKATTIR